MVLHVRTFRGHCDYVANQKLELAARINRLTLPYQLLLLSLPLLVVNFGLGLNLIEALACLPLEPLCLLGVELAHELLETVLEIGHLAFEGQANALALYCLGVRTLCDAGKLLVRQQ